ncbi:MAG: hypothetical protein ACHQ1G_12895 [Planctomycetota bacterium]
MLALLLGSLALEPPRAGAEVRERVLAAVDRRPILLSEVKALEAVRGLARAAAVDALIDEDLMLREASRLPAAAAAASLEDKAYAELLAARPGLLDLAAEADLRRLVRRQAVILQYVNLRFLPQVRVSDEVVREAYAAEYAARPDAPSFAEVGGSLREALVRRDVDARIEGWVKELRAGAEIRYNP